MNVPSPCQHDVRVFHLNAMGDGIFVYRDGREISLLDHDTLVALIDEYSGFGGTDDASPMGGNPVG